MIYPIYAVRDLMTGFMSPTVDMNDVSAARNFTHAVKTSDGVMHTNPSDFDLFRVGSFDTETGQIDSVWPIELITSGGDVRDI